MKNMKDIKGVKGMKGMKGMKGKIKLIIACYLFFSFKVFSQDLPIYSEDALRIYSLSIVDKGSRYIYADTLVYTPDSVVSCYFDGVGGEDVLDKLFKVNFRYRLMNVSDNINGYVLLYAKDCNIPIFYGFASYTGEDIKKGLNPMYFIDLGQFVPLPIEADEAIVFLVNEDNLSYSKIYLEKDNESGKILFPSYLAGSKGILVLRVGNDVISYDLWRPSSSRPSSSFEKSYHYKIKNHYIFNVTERAFNVEIIETFYPSLTLKIDSDYSIVYFNDVKIIGKGDKLIKPKSIIVQVEDKEYYYESYKIFFERGLWRVRFSWPQ
jgi:hypothetical protein